MKLDRHDRTSSHVYPVLIIFEKDVLQIPVEGRVLGGVPEFTLVGVPSRGSASGVFPRWQVHIDGPPLVGIVLREREEVLILAEYGFSDFRSHQKGISKHKLIRHLEGFLVVGKLKEHGSHNGQPLCASNEEKSVDVVHQLISQESSIFDCALDQFTLEVRLSMLSLDVRVAAHEGVESTELVEHDKYFIRSIAIEAWYVSANEGDSSNTES